MINCAFHHPPGGCSSRWGRQKGGRQGWGGQSSRVVKSLRTQLLPVPPFLYNAENIFIFYFLKTAVFLGMLLQESVKTILQIPFNFMASVKGKFVVSLFCFFVVSGFFFFLFLDCGFLHDMQGCLLWGPDIWDHFPIQVASDLLDPTMYQEFDVQFHNLPATFLRSLEGFCELYCFGI